MLVLLEAQEENWDEIDLMVRAFQQATHGAALRRRAGRRRARRAWRSAAAARSRCTATACRRRPRPTSAWSKSGVGLIPAGGGTKEMVARAAEQHAARRDRLPAADPARLRDDRLRARRRPAARTRSGSATCGPIDGVTMNRERLIADAKARALQRVAEGYQPPAPRTAIPVGGDAVLAPLKLGVHLAWRAGRISDHDALIGRKLATIMAGGALPHPTTVSEQHLLDLEREAFLSLVGERKTQERIQHTLKTGQAAAELDGRVIVDGMDEDRRPRMRAPVVVVPGIQGRWEWMTPAVDALAQRCRVDHVLARRRADARRRASTRRPGSTCYVEQVARGAGRVRASSARSICGVSYGGLIAAAFARAASRNACRRSSSCRRCRRRGGRTRASAFYLRAPRLLSPLFCSRRCGCTARSRRRTAAGWRGVWPPRPARAATSLTHMFSPGADGAARARCWRRWRSTSELARVRRADAGRHRRGRARPRRAGRADRANTLRIWPHATRRDARAHRAPRADHAAGRVRRHRRARSSSARPRRAEDRDSEERRVG